MLGVAVLVLYREQNAHSLFIELHSCISYGNTLSYEVLKTYNVKELSSCFYESTYDVVRYLQFVGYKSSKDSVSVKCMNSSGCRNEVPH